MTPEEAYDRSTAYLDEATENLTFDKFAWSFEEAWYGVGWALNALLPTPYGALDLEAPGGLPRVGTLASLRAAVIAPPANSAGVVARMEALGRALSGLDAEAALDARADEVEQLVFDAWELHDACGQRLGVVDERLGDRLMLTEVSPGKVGSKVLDRRDALKFILAGSVVPLAACSRVERDNRAPEARATELATSAPKAALPSARLKVVTPLNGTLWKTSDPFLFCAYHLDAYPAGNTAMGPSLPLVGRKLGRDFAGKDNWNMYHGRVVPGFPRHPHRGFETVTFVRTGLLDHSDSMGATARYGGGDVQWLTAGGGIQHAEMFPLIDQEGPNPLELYQIWLNLPASDKMVAPHFTMLWSGDIPRVVEKDSEGRVVELTLAAGRYKNQGPPSPPPNSWASRPTSDVAIWMIKMEPGARFVMPAVSVGTLRSLYVHRGAGLEAGDRAVGDQHRIELEDPGTLNLVAGAETVEMLLLQGRPIGEPVARRGPFVMNTQDEIKQAYADYRRTQFGGWSWGGGGPVHPRDKGRFARHIDGTFEEPG